MEESLYLVRIHSELLTFLNLLELGIELYSKKLSLFCPLSLLLRCTLDSRTEIPFSISFRQIESKSN